jgi:alpha-L-arabinofuranosidase
MADTIGQMMANGVQITAQWNLANGQAVNGSDFGLVHADTYDRYPAYYIFRLWSQFGSKMFPLTNSLAADTSLSVYAGQNDEDTITILAVNKTGEAFEASILLENSTPIINGFADILAGESLDSLAVTFNGQNNAAADFSDVHPSPIEVEGNPFIYTFTPYSVTLLQLKLAS